jgi:pyroglutamyl-peptidase
MPRILVTAFEPYDRWTENSSWLTLVEFTKHLDDIAKITTRLYPVDFAIVRQRLESDLAADFDYALHLGQAPGSASLRLEAIGLNLGGDAAESRQTLHPLVADGPVAYRSALPLGQWAAMLRDSGIPAAVSYHAGTFLCNATLYVSHYLAERHGLRTKSTFLHLPLDICQAAKEHETLPALPASVSAKALRMIIAEIVKQQQPRDLEPA